VYTYLAVLYRKRGNYLKVQEYGEKALETAVHQQRSLYIATAKSNMAWRAWREGDLARAEELSHQALQIWDKGPVAFPLKWLALWPLLGLALGRNEVGDAIENAKKMLEPSQQKLPDGMTILLEQAVRAWDNQNPVEAKAALKGAVPLAQELGYL